MPPASPVPADRRFDGLAEVYDRWEELTGDPVGDWLPGVLPGGATALDATCGSGRHALLLAERYDDVLAVDLSADMIERARAVRPHPRIRYVQGDLHDQRGRYDLVFTSAALHDVPDLDRALLHLRSLVAPGGTLIVVDIAADGALRSGRAPRWTVRAAMLRGLLGDLRRRDRHAWERYRLGTHPVWLAHLASDDTPEREQLRERCLRRLPGARDERLQYLHAFVWTAPAGG
ncbi:class I SAM-dependent methyltransferase [Patulibacter defluvii]|uniref:class I SAM-dependent methyltransferase n=1 Tax=Patulibacter defluvii TaxID=3095358 RepID=UPI002A74B886|nr:class I SAM-dependent methyltransferase [Patulibacter sp. DM4]